MAKQHGAKQQKHLAKQKAKRNQKRRQLARQTSSNPRVRFKDAANWPIVHASVAEGIWDEGIGQVVLSRRMPRGEIVAAVFLVDVFALGVKNAFHTIQSPEMHGKIILDIDKRDPQEDKSPEYVARLIQDAVAYAHSLGIPPHRDFHNAALLLQGIDPTRCLERFEFGRAGVPTYINGPHDSPQRMRALADRIEAAGGKSYITCDPAQLGLLGLADDESDDWDENEYEDDEFDADGSDADGFDANEIVEAYRKAFDDRTIDEPRPTAEKLDQRRLDDNRENRESQFSGSLKRGFLGWLTTVLRSAFRRQPRQLSR